MVCCSTLTTSVWNGAPYVSPFGEQSSASFNSEAAAVGIRGTAGAIGTTGTVGILDRIWRERRTVEAVGVARRVRIIRVRAQLAAIVPLLVIQPRSICPAGVPMYEYKTRPHLVFFTLKVIRDQAKLFQNCFEVVDDFLGDDDMASPRTQPSNSQTQHSLGLAFNTRFSPRSVHRGPWLETTLRIRLPDWPLQVLRQRRRRHPHLRRQPHNAPETVPGIA